MSPAKVLGRRLSNALQTALLLGAMALERAVALRY